MPPEQDEEGLLPKGNPESRSITHKWFPCSVLVISLAAVALLAFLNSPSRASTANADLSEVLQAWLPSTEDEVLPKKKWAKVFHVQHPNSTLGSRRYYEYSHHPAFIVESARLQEIVQWQIAHDCPKLSVGMDMVTSRDLPVIENITSASICQKICTETIECQAFVWGYQRNRPGLTDRCFRRAFSQLFEDVQPSRNTDVVGGLPCFRQPVSDRMWWPREEMEFFDLPQARPQSVALHTSASSTRMLCLAVFLPFTYEQDLLLMQYRFGTNIFACDQHAIYSSTRLELAPGLISRRVPTTLLSELGGPYITVLNLAAFMAVWRQVLLDGDYLQCDWTIKADPDTVFIPQRLVPILSVQSLSMGANGKYLNNCQDGLHGPLEIFSQGALTSLGRHALRCAKHLDGGDECKEHCEKFWDFNYKEKCNGHCTKWWGEDIWLDQCLSRFAAVTRVFVPELLQEDHCHPKPGWRNCLDPHTVAFHPFKSPDDYQTCLGAALNRQILL
ncbi:unnamed protein product [Symbiodinium natans]|uniref:Apple domain-containing protein n=1 Tax=Symbiodinium natans TaxID=878477 RepID=A0A812S1R5_9DINO|nr:unnamed protein product [Symbiodinium natans]